MARSAGRQALILTAALLAGAGLAQAAPRYSVKTIGDIVQLRDAAAAMTVSVLTPVNNAYEIVVKGKNLTRMQLKSVDDMRARPGLNGVPFLAPFANRLDQDAFYANGKKYNFDMELGNVRGAIPIHGFLTGTSAWKVVAVKADAKGAWITSKLDFYKYPDYMKQFPFAHILTMTYRLANGALEVRTRIDNLSAEPMPVAIGFHPYFALSDSVRQDWTLEAPARTHWLLSDTKVPTGQTEPSENFFGGDPHAVPLSRFAVRDIDDVFSDLERDAQGRGTFTVHGARQSIGLTIGPKFRAMLIYSTVPAVAGGARAGRGPGAAVPAPPPVSVGPPVPLSASDTTPVPPDRGFVAFEPYAGVSDGMNLAQKGLYNELQTIPPGKSWQESFWITPQGY